MKKVSRKKRISSHNAISCYVDGRRYNSLYAAAIDFEIDFKWIYIKLSRNNNEPVTISGHKIVLEIWLKSHPEYDLESDTRRNQ